MEAKSETLVSVVLVFPEKLIRSKIRLTGQLKISDASLRNTQKHLIFKHLKNKHLLLMYISSKM